MAGTFGEKNIWQIALLMAFGGLNDSGPHVEDIT